jgi:hypothetical protein
MAGILDGAIGLLIGRKARPVEDDFQIVISRNKLNALLTSYNDNVEVCLRKNKELVSDYLTFKEDLITRMKSLEGKYGQARAQIAEAERERDEAKAEAEQAKSELSSHINPEEGDESIAARELIAWGYEEGDLPAIQKFAEKNKPLIERAMTGEDGEQLSVIETLRSNRFIIQLALKNNGILTAEEKGKRSNNAQQQEGF